MKLNWRQILLVTGVALSAAVVLADTTEPTAHKAPPAQRQLEVELEEIEGATAYEIELKSVVTGKIAMFKMKKPLWKARVKPGKYNMRLRSYDERGVVGEWADAGEFIVAFPAPRLVLPKQDDSIFTNSDENGDIEFSWEPVPGAQKYRLDVFTEVPASEEGNAPSENIVFTQVVEGTKYKGSLAVAKKYFWRVTAVMPTGEDGEKIEEPGRFTMIAKKLNAPDVERPMDRYVQKLTWEKPPRAETFSYSLSRQEGNGWKTVEKKSGITANEIDLAYNQPGGNYRLQVRAEAPYTEPSAISTIQFDVYDGNRSPTAVEEARLRDSMEKPTTWYAIASYLISNITYQGTNAEHGNGGQKVVFPDALGGTGRLGIGYFKPNSPSGYIGIADLGGLTIAGENVTFASLEAHYARRYYLGVNQLRVSGGLFYKELPQSFRNNDGTFKYAKISFAGPHVGADFWHPFSFKYGMQLNARLYVSAMTMSTPNGEDIFMTPSYQLGFMGTMRLSRSMIGFAGLAHRQDSAKYKKHPNSNSAADNEVTLTGNYLNLVLEYGF